MPPYDGVTPRGVGVARRETVLVVLMRMTVIGCGYLGVTHAACMAELGHEVMGLDVDAEKIASLSSGHVPFFEPGLQEVLSRNVAAGRLRFTTSAREAAEFATVHFVGVGTPQQRDSQAADLTFVHAAVDALMEHISGHHVILGKSTVPVGTAERLQRRVTAALARRDGAGEAGPQGRPETTVEVAWNPEFLREGYAVRDTICPDRIVLGTAAQQQLPGGGRAEAVVREIYAQALAQEVPFIVTDLATAELVKVSANAFLATKISFINAVAQVCEAAGADVVTLARALGLDDRIGPKFLGAGLGFGGGCLPKDIRAFMARAGELGAQEAVALLREVDTINLQQRDHVVRLAEKACGGSVLGARITVLGAAFKPNSDDVRDSPALAVAGALLLAGAQVTVFDPQAMDNARRAYPALSYAPDVEAALRGADCVIVATEWQQFKDLDPRAAAAVVRRRVVIDGRNALDVPAWQEAGWQVTALGRCV